MKQKLDQLENSAIDVIAVFAPWLGPIPSAYLVGRACINYLHWHWSIAWVAAVAVESIGVVSVVLSLRLYEWNDRKNKTDPSAPFKLSLFLVAVYFVVTIGLTVLLDVFPELARFAPAIFPFLAAVGAVNIAVKNGQQRREELKKEQKQERKSIVSKPEGKPKRKPENTGNLPLTQVTDWRTLPLNDREKVADMETSEVVSEYGVSERTARNWRQNARQLVSSNGHRE